MTTTVVAEVAVSDVVEVVVVVEVVMDHLEAVSVAEEMMVTKIRYLIVLIFLFNNFFFLKMVDLVVEVGEADSEIAVDLVIVVAEVAIVVVTVVVVAAGVAVEAMAVIAEASVGEEVAIEEDTIVADEAEVAVVRHLGKHYKFSKQNSFLFTVFLQQ